jgi:hypothetical protein
MLQAIKKIKIDSETITLTLISLGLPYIAYIYFSTREAITTFIIVQIVLGLIRIKFS